MIKWISVETPPMECSMAKEYLVTAEYKYDGSVNGRKTFVMTYEEKGKKRVPTWCWMGKTAVWKVLFWAELPEPCQTEV